MPKKPERFRVCAVCGKRHAATYSFRLALRAIGIAGDEAVPTCVIKAQRAFDMKQRAEGMPACR